MSYVSLKVPEEELTLFRNYAKINNKSLSEVVRNIMLDRIEEEYDLKLFEEYEKTKNAGSIKTYSHDEVWKALGV